MRGGVVGGSSSAAVRPAACADDDDADPFDALMRIDAAEFSDILDASPPSAPAAPPLLRGGVPVVDLADVTAATFRERFLAPRRPVILRDPEGAVVPLHLTLARLRDRHGDVVVPLDVTSPDPVDVRLRDFLDAVCDDDDLDAAAADDLAGTEPASSATEGDYLTARSRPPPPPPLRSRYLRNLQMREWFPEEARACHLPECFGANALEDVAKTPGALPAAWRDGWFELFVNHPEGAGFPFLHRDTCHVHAVSMQIQGRKRFVMFPPEDARYLYPLGGGSGTRSKIPAAILFPPEPRGEGRAGVRHAGEGFSGGRAVGSGGGAVGGVSGTRADASERAKATADLESTLREFPGLAHARKITCDVDAGEMLFVPADWWHCARATGARASASLAASFVDDEGADAFADAFAEMAALKALATVGAGKVE